MATNDDKDQDQLSPMRAVDPAIQAAIKQCAALTETYQRQLQELMPAYEQIQRDFLEPMRKLQQQAAQLIEPIEVQTRQFSRQLAPALSEFTRSVDEFPARARAGLLAMAEAGWYLDPEMPAIAIQGIKKELESRPSSKAGIAVYFRRNLDRIESDLVRRHPHRAHLFRSALVAHRQGSYDLSIPALLAQADGVCRDLTGSQLFRQGLHRYANGAKLEVIERAYLAPLLQQIPVIYPEGRRAKEFQELNRHAVMHGEVLDFGTEENGLKSLSLLNYVSYVLSGEDRRNSNVS